MRGARKGNGWYQWAMLLAHVSDIHVDAGERSVARTARVVRYLAAMATPPDAVLVTGDIADHGTEEEYARVRELFDLPVPVLWCPGNHDDRAAYRKFRTEAERAETTAAERAAIGVTEPAAATETERAAINEAHVVAGVLILMVDSSVPGRSDGLLGDETVAWMEARLAEEPDRAALIAFHHPPVVLGLPFVDRIRQFEEQRLAALVRRHPQVVALLCGHAHTPAATTFAGRPLVVAPGVVSTLMLPAETAAIVDEQLPPMIAFHLLDDERRLTTHFRVIP